MMPPGEVIAVVGSDPKAGASMAAKSIAQGLAKETGEAVLYLNGRGESCVVAPWNESEMGLTEAGLSYLLSLRWSETYGELRGKFSFTVADGGTGPAEGADRVVLVVNQLASSIRAAERAAERLCGTEKKLLCLNRFLPSDPHTPSYVRKLFPEWDVILLPESPRGREADWEGMTLPVLGDRPYRRAVREGVKWILNS